MYFLIDICCICLKNANHLQRLFNSCENLNYFSRLVQLFPEMISAVLRKQGAICPKCRSKVDEIYEYRKQCLRNNQIYINYTSQLSSVSETSGVLSISLTHIKEERKELLENCEQSDDEYSRTDILPARDENHCVANEAWEDFYHNSYRVKTEREENNHYTGVNMNDETGGDIHSDDSRESDIEAEIDIKPEYEATDDYVVMDEIKHTTEMEDDVAAGDTGVYQDHTYTGKIAVKSEPVDTSECEENTLESAAVTNTENRDTKKTHIISSTDDMSQYNYNTNIIINEELDIKPECGDDCEYDAEQDAEIRDIPETYYMLTIDEMSQYNYNTNIMTEKVNIKSDAVDCGEYEGSDKSEYGNDSDYIESGDEDKTSGTSSSESDESWEPLVINKCKQPTTSLNLIRRKRRHSGERPFKCNQCDKAFFRPDQLLSHKRIHSGERPFKCDQCDKAFTQGSALFEHKRIHSGEKPFKCDQCDKAFTHGSTLNQHKRIHSGEKPFKCDQCDKAFTHGSTLNQHKRIHSGKMPFKCDQCNKTFSGTSSLRRHKRLHSGERPYKCEECDKAFSRASQLLYHKHIHSGERPFKCDQCDKTYFRPKLLLSHKMYAHFGESPFKCDQCAKVFSQSSHFRYHKRIHSGERPFKCDQCGKAFSQQTILTIHKRIHSGERPFKCDQCDKAFSQSSNLRYHKGIHSNLI